MVRGGRTYAGPPRPHIVFPRDESRFSNAEGVTAKLENSVQSYSLSLSLTPFSLVCNPQAKLCLAIATRRLL